MRASEKQKPRWFWTGVNPLEGMEDDSRLRELVAMLPARKSSDREILAYLVDLRAHFRRWMHQDESGPDRSNARLHSKHRSMRHYERGAIRIVWFWRPFMRRPGMSRRSGAAMAHLTATLSGSRNCKIAFMS